MEDLDNNVSTECVEQGTGSLCSHSQSTITTSSDELSYNSTEKVVNHNVLNENTFTNDEIEEVSVLEMTQNIVQVSESLSQA